MAVKTRREIQIMKLLAGHFPAPDPLGVIEFLSLTFNN